MSAPKRSSRIAVVTGDLTIDWNLARTRRDPGDAAAWNADDSTRAYWQRGGAALVADVVAAVSRALEEAGRASWDVRRIAAPTDAVCPEDLPYHHSYAIWSNRGGAKDPPTWRVEEYLGLDPRSAHSPPGPDDAQKVVDDTPDADIVVLDDAALGFREQPDLWPAAVTTRGRRPWVVLKMARPVAQGALWDHLLRDHGERLIVVMTVNDLRRTEVQISRELSWERTAQDLAWELVHNPRVNGLSRCAQTIVSFDTAGAFLLSSGGDAAPRRPASRLFFDPPFIEGAWSQAHPGGVIGYTTCLAVGIIRQLMINSETPNLPAGVQAGLAAMRELHLRGYGDGGAIAPTANLRFPVPLVARELGTDQERFKDVAVQDPVRFLTQPVDCERSSAPRFWSILEERHAGELTGVAERIVEHGPEQALSGVPVGQFGKLLTADRREIEGFRAIRALMLEYTRRGRAKPLSIAVFGAPGSGKSFGVSEVAASLLPGRIEPQQFNLSQFTGPADLHDALHQVRDIGLSGKLPLVFWDEFDTALGAQRLGWLRHFLAPMQDGSFQQGQVVHPIGRSIFVFAGGTRPTMEAFLGQAKDTEFAAVKGPDFVSRLKGFIDILGPDRQGSTPEAKLLDVSHVIRRAILLRSIIRREAPQLFQREGSIDRLNIDRGVMRAFLHTRNYRHGVRSMESIVAMSTLTGKRSYERSSLPPAHQLDVHVDALDFQVLVQQPELTGELLERLAKAAHEIYCEGKKRDGFTWGERKDPTLKTTPLLVAYDALEERDKEANRVTVRSIPRKLAAAGYVMIPSRSDDPPFAFPGPSLEMLAELEHEIWMEAKLADGWLPGRATPEEPKRNEYLVAWDQVPDDIKQADRDLVIGIPRILAAAGYAVVNVDKTGAIEAV